MTAFNSGDEPEHRPIRLDTLLDDALSLIQSVLPTNLVLQKDIGQDIASILGDPTQINQVILNLCLKYKVPFGTTPSGPKAAAGWVKKGCTFFEMDSEMGLIASGARQIVETYG